VTQKKNPVGRPKKHGVNSVSFLVKVDAETARMIDMLGEKTRQAAVELTIRRGLQAMQQENPARFTEQPAQKTKR